MTPFERIDRAVRLVLKELRADAADVEKWDCCYMDAPEALPAGAMWNCPLHLFRMQLAGRSEHDC